MKRPQLGDYGKFRETQGGRRFRLKYKIALISDLEAYIDFLEKKVETMTEKKKCSENESAISSVRVPKGTLYCKKEEWHDWWKNTETEKECSNCGKVEVIKLPIEEMIMKYKFPEEEFDWDDYYSWTRENFEEAFNISIELWTKSDR